jgi:hypothetical protein
MAATVALSHDAPVQTDKRNSKPVIPNNGSDVVEVGHLIQTLLSAGALFDHIKDWNGDTSETIGTSPLWEKRLLHPPKVWNS